MLNAFSLHTANMGNLFVPRCRNRNHYLRTISLFAVCATVLSGCGTQDQLKGSSPSAPLVLQGDLLGAYQESDYNTALSGNITQILLQGADATIEGGGASIADGVITITAPGDYLVSGSLADGQLRIHAEKDDRVHVVLKNASISNQSGAPFYVSQCEKLILTLAAGSENTLTDTTNYLFSEGEDEPDATLFSKDDLTINGEGSLLVTASYRNGIASKDSLVIISGRLAVTAPNDALRGRDSVSIQSGTFALTAGNDGIKSNNDTDPAKGVIAIDGGDFVIDAGADGIQAETTLSIGDGAFSIKTGGGSVNLSTEAAPLSDESRSVAKDADRSSPPLGEPPAPRQSPAGRQSSSADPTAVEQASPPIPVQAAASAAEAASSEQASAKGIKANALSIYGGSFSLDCLDDALHANSDLTIYDGSFSIATDDDALHADAAVTIQDGRFEILRCYEGIEGNVVTINGGSISLTARDDGVNAAGESEQADSASRFSTKDSSIVINGGTLDITASGDGIDSNGTITQTGGTVFVNGPQNGADSAIDCDGALTLDGGILAAAGTASRATTASQASKQPRLFIKFSSRQPAKTCITLTNSDGKDILSFAPSKDFEGLLLTCSALALGERYTLSASDEALCTVTLAEASTTINSDGSAISELGGRGGGGRGAGARPQATT